MIHKEPAEQGMKEQSLSRVSCLFPDEILEFTLCFKREESMATPAEHEALLLLPHQPSFLSPPSFENFSLSWILGRCNYCAVDL